MITLITGVPGAGKTLRTLELMDAFVQAGRPVWTNIADCTLPGVMQLKPDWGGHWQDFDDGTVFVIDEVQETWRSTGRTGQSQNDDITALEKHRHRGMDFILTTQHPTFVHSHVRKLVGKHEHLNRPRGSKTIGISVKDHYFNITDSAELKTADFQIWRHPKKYFKYYKSATIHTHKFKVPFKVAAVGSIALVLLIAGITLLSKTFIFQGAPGAPDIEVAYTPPPMASDKQDWAAVPQLKTVLGCISTYNKCQCYGATGQPLQVSTPACMRHTESPLPITIIIGGEGRSEVAPSPVVPSLNF